MKPQRMLLTRRSHGASRDGQFNRLSELLHRYDKGNKTVAEKKVAKGIDSDIGSCYNLNLDR